VCDLPPKGDSGEGRVCKYMHARAIHNAVAQGRTVQKGGSNPHNPPAYHTLISSQWRSLIWLDGWRVPGAKDGGAKTRTITTMTVVY